MTKTLVEKMESCDLDQKIKILWIDDEIDERLIKNIRPYFKIVLQRSPLKARIQVSERSFQEYDAIVTDLKMPELDGIQLYDSFPKKIQNGTLFCSANLVNSDYEDGLNDRGIRQNRKIDCDHLADADTLIRVTDKILRQVESNNIKNVVLDDYLEFPFEKKTRILNYVKLKNEEAINNHFKCSNDSWIIISDDKIIDSGGLNNQPCSLDLYDIAIRRNSPVFLIHRGVIVENIHISSKKEQLSGQVKFRSVEVENNPTIPDYPIISMNIVNEMESNLIADLDTGNYTNFIDEKVLLSLFANGEIKTYQKLKEPSILPVNGVECAVVPWKIKFTLSDNDRPKYSLFMVVIEWQNTFMGKFYKKRKALIGRNFLIDHKLKVLIDGEKNITQIL